MSPPGILCAGESPPGTCPLRPPHSILSRWRSRPSPDGTVVPGACSHLKKKHKHIFVTPHHYFHDHLNYVVFSLDTWYTEYTWAQYVLISGQETIRRHLWPKGAITVKLQQRNGTSIISTVQSKCTSVAEYLQINRETNHMHTFLIFPCI